ncbi:MAG: hypothetical protein JG776_1906 [Caloramator sp.]|nr:hypothetical protein [Caloramator sp.]
MFKSDHIGIETILRKIKEGDPKKFKSDHIGIETTAVSIMFKENGMV